MRKKIIIIFSIIISILISTGYQITMAQTSNSCTSCPRKLGSLCKLEWDATKTGVCQSDQEWYYYEMNIPNTEVWIEVKPQPGLDVDLYATWNKRCPDIDDYDCISNSGGNGQSEVCHHVISTLRSPQYLLVHKVEGSGCYDIILSHSQPTTVKMTLPTTITSTGKTEVSPLTFILLGIVILVVIILFFFRRTLFKI